MGDVIYGFIGCGNMAQAIIRGMLTSKFTDPEKIICSSPPCDEKMLEQVKSLRCRTTFKNLEVLDASSVLILAVKPPIMPAVLEEIAPQVTGQHLVISIAMGIGTKDIEKDLPSNTRVIRVMPNLAAEVQEGASVISLGSAVLEGDADIAKRIFSSVGFCGEISEDLQDAATGLIGSGPAYMYMALEAMSDGGVKMGIQRDLSIKLAAQTMMGAAKMVLETGQHPGFLKDGVCSPGGSTITAVHELEKNGFRSALISAVEVATLRSKGD